ncbi:hypothetical protein ACFRJ9_21660 [Paenarthrobacter sp. NPDC056912]|uniref:hypothetical protein n=1 Tax=Paenarthrobacter sp. NPDC056912 TaxID=3345965 RepID=UPI00366C4F6D
MNNVWNQCVSDVTAFFAERPKPARSTSRSSPEVKAMVDAARRRLHVLLWDYPARRRDTLSAVAHAVLDRIERTGELRIPVPERNLVLDTGIASRPAIREALRFIDGKLGSLHKDGLDHAAPESGSFEFELIPAQGGAVLEFSPPSSHTPLPRSTTWLTLPRPARRLWQSLLQNGSLPLRQLCQSAALSKNLTASVSESTLRTGRKTLAALAAAGLVRCDSEGLWTAITTVTPEHAGAAAAAANRLADGIHYERQAYRQRRAGTWQAQRRRALAKDHRRYRMWWDALSAEKRTARQERHAEAFHRLPLTAQETFKAQRATQRIAAGINETDRYRSWREGLSPNEALQRSTERAHAFATLPAPLQQSAVISWENHRARFGLPAPNRLQVPQDRDKPAPLFEQQKLFLLEA